MRCPAVAALPTTAPLQIFYRSALKLSILQGRESLLQWALHGLQAGVDTILTVRAWRCLRMRHCCVCWPWLAVLLLAD